MIVIPPRLFNSSAIAQSTGVHVVASFGRLVKFSFGLLMLEDPSAIPGTEAEENSASGMM